MNIGHIILNCQNIGIYIGIVIDLDDNKCTIRSLLNELVQFDCSIFEQGVSLQDRVLITKCFKTKKTNGVILPPEGWFN